MSTGGRFPSDLNVNRTFGATRTLSSDSSDDRDTINAGAVAVPPLTSQHAEYSRGDENPYRLQGIASESPTVAAPARAASYDEDQARYMPYQPQQQAPVNHSMFLPGQQDLAQQPASAYQPPVSAYQQPVSTYQQPATIDPRENQHADWIAPAAVGAGAGVVGTAAYNHYNNRDRETEMQQQLQEQQPTNASNDITPNAAPTPGVEAAPAVAPVVAPVNNADSTPLTNNAPTDRDLESAPRATGIPGSVDNPPLATEPAVNGGTYLSYPSETGTGLAGSSSASPPVASLDQSMNGSAASPVTGLDKGLSGANTLGGHEAQGAHETGHIFPKVIRHDTDISVSQLHVPGEFPDRSAGL
jgi:hypothetical protein